jgi:hypothetical protein
MAKQPPTVISTIPSAGSTLNYQNFVPSLPEAYCAVSRMINVAVERVALKELVEKYQNRYIFATVTNPALLLKEK